MRIDFRKADFDALAAAWGRFYSAKYAVDADLIRFNSVESPVFDWGASAIELSDSGEVEGFVIVKQSASSLYKGPDRDTAHLSAIAFEDANIGVDLFSYAKRTLRNRGLARIVFGMDSRHFFPGCPVDASVLQNFLMIEGFASGGEAVDLERDLSTYKNPVETPAGYEYRILLAEDFGALDTFLEREFPGRWRYDVRNKIETMGGVEGIFGMFQGSTCHGFAMLQNWTHKTPIGGGVWRADLGEHWGSLGPIGVSKDLRGKGTGNALLGLALEYQRDLGVKRCIIDWTGLVRFYGGHGFEVNRTYKSMTLSLEPQH